MKDTLFRGKRKDNGEWVEGYFATVNPVDIPARNRKPKAIIFPNEARCNWFNKYFYNAVEVIPETVGQFTGLVDCYGKKIFEGDIVRLYCGIYGTYEMHILDIRNGFKPIEEEKIKEIDIIGNIHDNPELLEAAYQ